LIELTQRLFEDRPATLQESGLPLSLASQAYLCIKVRGAISFDHAALA
jgi:hypothetical protein